MTNRSLISSLAANILDVLSRFKNTFKTPSPNTWVEIYFEVEGDSEDHIREIQRTFLHVYKPNYSHRIELLKAPRIGLKFIYYGPWVDKHRLGKYLSNVKFVRIAEILHHDGYPEICNKPRLNYLHGG